MKLTKALRHLPNKLLHDMLYELRARELRARELDGASLSDIITNGAICEAVEAELLRRNGQLNTHD